MRVISALFAATMMSAVVGTASLAHGQSSLPPLSTVKEIDRPMLWVALAVEISDRCDSIAPRTLKGLAKLADLRSQAKSLGYSDSQIASYVQSDAEKARIRGLGEAYVKSKGFSPSSPADLCTLGQAEIARNSAIGTLLRAK